MQLIKGSLQNKKKSKSGGFKTVTFAFSIFLVFFILQMNNEDSGSRLHIDGITRRALMTLYTDA